MIQFHADLDEAVRRVTARQQAMAQSDAFAEVRRHVVEVLQRRMGKAVSELKCISVPISHWVLSAQQEGKLPLSGGTVSTRDQNYQTFLDGIDKTVEAGHVILSQMQATADGLAARGFTDHPDIVSVRPG